MQIQQIGFNYGRVRSLLLGIGVNELYGNQDALIILLVFHAGKLTIGREENPAPLVYHQRQ